MFSHQDSAYFLLRNPSDAVTLWLALDDVDEENGAISYVRGSHLHGLRPHVASGVLGFSRSLADWGEADAAMSAVQRAAPGDLLMHHGLTIHSAGANNSATRYRRAIGMIYYSATAEVDEAAKAAYHEKLYKDLQQKGRI
jgi:phytanoyl-CoA hydroxylase